MNMAHVSEKGTVNFWEPGFFMESIRNPSSRPIHWHNEVEIALLERGRATELYGRRRSRLVPGGLVLLWGTLPHGILKSSQTLLVRSLHIPLPWVLQWRLPAVIMDPLLRGEVLQDAPRKKPGTDTDLMRHWQALMQEGGHEAREIVLLDIQRRLRLMARSLAACAAAHREPAEQEGAFERMALAIAREYARPVKVREITTAAGFSESHGMRLFKRVSGMSIVDYLTRIRISMAQRLLVTTDLKISEVACQSGFNTVCRFYIAFRQLCGQTPRKYRLAMRHMLAR